MGLNMLVNKRKSMDNKRKIAAKVLVERFVIEDAKIDKEEWNKLEIDEHI